MRAKEINFERGLDPKATMDLGGVNFQETFDAAYEKWMSTIQALDGKTITGEIEKHWMDKGGMPRDEFKKRSVKVREVDKWASVESMGGGHSVSWKLYFYGVDGFRYSLNLNQKIYIK